MMDSSPTPPLTSGPKPAGAPNLDGSFVGETIDGRYQIVRRLAKGGMAHVFLAKDRAPGRRCPVAIKILHNERARRRFEIEAQILSNVQCEHIVRAIAFGETADGWPFLVLEHLEGETLGQRLAHGPLPWREVARFGIQIAAGLHVLHTAGIVHRDVKPDNIVIAIGADRSLAKVIDLGLASVGAPFHEAQAARFASQVAPRHKTQLGRVIGTPEYLPPEAGTCDAAPTLDVFALGTTLYQLCTQVLPRMTGARSIHEVVPNSDAPEELSRLIRAALEPDAGDRLPSADHLRRGLEAILDAHPEHPRPRPLFGGSYDRLEVLGVGASAVVHRASDRWLSREIALKVLRAAEPDEDDVIRFIRAAKILSALNHPNIPRILHFGQDGKQHFAVTELCCGVPATEFMRPDRHLRPDEVVAVGRQLASALAATHAAGVVYRDLYGSNVLIARGEAPKAWIFDFDQAQVSPAFYARLTERWATPPEERVEPKREKPLRGLDHTAPEVKAGAAFTPASDVFALGLLLYRLLTGHRPFPPWGGETLPPRKVCPACPLGLERLLMLMLNPAPGARPMLAEIERSLADVQAEIEEEIDEAEAPPALEPAARSAALVPSAAAGTQTATAALESVEPSTTTPTPTGATVPSAATDVGASEVPASRTRSAGWLALAIVAAVMLLFAVAPGDAPPVEAAAHSAGPDPRELATTRNREPAAALPERRGVTEPEPAPAVEREGAAEPEPASPPVQRDTTTGASRPESAASPRKSPTRTWEMRMRDVEAHARQCLVDARVEPRRVTVLLVPDEPVEFTNVPEDSPHARCVREALDHLEIRTDITRRRDLFDTL